MKKKLFGLLDKLKLKFVKRVGVALILFLELKLK
jgi:hypothetical protein